MAQENFEGVERKRFPALMLLGLALAAVVIVVGFLIDTEYGIPLLLLTVICALAAIAYRVLAGSQRRRLRGQRPQAAGDRRRPAPRRHGRGARRDQPARPPPRQPRAPRGRAPVRRHRGHDDRPAAPLGRSRPASPAARRSPA